MKICLIYILTIMPWIVSAQNKECEIDSPLNVGSCKLPSNRGQYYEMDIVADFGADPSGKKNSQAAFECAAYFFNNNGGNGKLIVPYGSYKVGNQFFLPGSEADCYSFGKFGWIGRNLLHFVNCKNLIIQGIPYKNKKPVIFFEDSLKVGGSTSKGRPSNFNKKINERYQLPANCNESLSFDTYRSEVGSLLWFEDCETIEVSNLLFDGNSKKFLLGAYEGIGDAPYELWCYGIVVWNSKKVSIFQTDVVYAGMDGIIVKNYTDKGPNTEDYNTLIEGCNISYSGRNNLSWVSGVGLTVINSSFNYAGTGRIKTNPCAGVDIEPEGHELRKSRCEYILEEGKTVIKQDYCINGTFINCTLKGNKSANLLNASPNKRTQKCQFINCIIEGRNSRFGIEITGENFIKFRRCKVFGKVAVNQIFKTTFIGDSNFSDSYLSN